MDAPRSFAGRRDASVLDFMTSYCTSLAKAVDEDPAPYVEMGTKIAKLAAKRGVGDLGAWVRSRCGWKVAEDLVAVTGDSDWLAPIEEILGMRFEVIASQRATESQMEMEICKVTADSYAAQRAPAHWLRQGSPQVGVHRPGRCPVIIQCHLMIATG